MSGLSFEDLSVKAKKKIAEKYIQEAIEKYREDGIEVNSSVLLRLQSSALQCSNAREIKHLIQGTFSLQAIRKICEIDSDNSLINKS